MKPHQKWTLSYCLAGSLLLAQSLHAQIVFTAENAGVQSTTVAGATTENFNELSAGALPGAGDTYVSSIGTFDGGVVVAANEYGGAGGTGNYYAIGSESGTTSATLTFKSPQDYFGMWWSAGDAENVLKFYDGATLVGTFEVGSIIPYLTSSYNGNPNSDFLDQDPKEPFDYLDFTAIGGDQITSVEFDNGLGTGFEMDDLSISDTVTTPPGNNPFNTPDTGNTGVMVLIAVATLLGYRLSRRSTSGNCAS
jgi:hypothetical protein